MNFLQKIFPPKLDLLNLGCSLSVSAAYTPVFTVSHLIHKISICSGNIQHIGFVQLDMLSKLKSTGVAKAEGQLT